jgi:hypothetical protein
VVLKIKCVFFSSYYSAKPTKGCSGEEGKREHQGNIQIEGTGATVYKFRRSRFFIKIENRYEGLTCGSKTNFLNTFSEKEKLFRKTIFNFVQNFCVFFTITVSRCISAFCH